MLIVKMASISLCPFSPSKGLTDSHFFIISIGEGLPSVHHNPAFNSRKISIVEILKIENTFQGKVPLQSHSLLYEIIPYSIPLLTNSTNLQNSLEGLSNPRLTYLLGIWPLLNL